MASLSNPNPFQAGSLCVVGNINRDVKLQAVPGSADLLQDGETSVQAVTETIGGGGANSACAAAALGARVHLIGKVGRDSLGEQLRNVMERHGVCTALKRDRETTTGTTVALGFTGGQRHFLSCLPNNETLRFEDLDLGPLAKSDHLLRADVWFSWQMLEEGNETLLCRAQESEVPTSLDINFDPIWATGTPPTIRRRKKLLRKVLPLVEMAHGNVRELCEFTDQPRLDGALKQLGDWGVRSVVVHLGTRGAGFYRDGKFIVEAANLARRPIHSAGTGDVLSICMILLNANDKLSIREKLRFSNRVVREFIEGRRLVIPEL